MRSLILLGLAAWISFMVGCGGVETPSSSATGPMAPEQHEQDIKDAIKSGKINPATYGPTK